MSEQHAHRRRGMKESVCKRISSMKALQLGCDIVKSTNFHWSIFESYSANMKLKFALLVLINQKCVFFCV